MLWREAGPPPDTADLFRDLLTILVGNLERESLVNISQEYRRKYLLPYGKLAPLGQETDRLRGEMRVQWFETLREGWLQRPERKIVVLPHGIYTLIYRQDKRRSGEILASLQKGRRVNGRIPTKQVYLGPAGSVTKELLWANSPVDLAVLAHHRLAAIHPFIDGNGRTARLIMNLVLLRGGYPPAIIARVNRWQYYRVLAQADGGKPAPLVNFVGCAVERSLTLYPEALWPADQQVCIETIGCLGSDLK